MAGLRDAAFDWLPMQLKGPLLGLHSKMTASSRYGSFYQQEVVRLRQNLATSQAALKLLEDRALSRFLEEVYFGNAFYRSRMRERGLSLDHFLLDPRSSLFRLDVTEKDFFRQNADVIAGKHNKPAFVAYTSGTSGSPMAVAYDAAGLQRGFAYWRRFYDTMGLGASFTNARFSGRNLVGRSQSPRQFWVYDWFERRLFMSTYHMNERNLPHYVEKLNQFKPELIDGYPSALFLLAKYVAASRPLSFTPKAVATTAETLVPMYRATIEAAFRCKVYDQYASSEGAPFITECRLGRMHLNTDTGFFEFHGNHIGGLRELVVTSYRNVLSPLIRYRVGDMVKLDEPNLPTCKCGSPFPTIASIEGRLDDLVWSRERGVVGRLDPIFKGLSGIEMSQFIQVGLDSYHILVVPNTDWSGSIAAAVDRKVRDRLGEHVKITFELVERLAPSPNGKIRAVVNRYGPPPHSETLSVSGGE